MSTGSGSAVDQWAERIVCRHQHGAAAKWTRTEEDPKYAPDRTCDVEHLRLNLQVDLEARSVEAVCTQTLRAAYGPFQSIALDACDLKIQSVRDGRGRDLPYTYLRQKLTVQFPEPVGDSEQLVISYRVEDPVDGLFFLGPDEYEPQATFQLWSQCQDEGARYWIPCHDAPNERMTCEMVVNAAEELSVIGNGALIGLERQNGRRIWHYRESVAIPSYLISLVAGVFSKMEDQCNGIPVEIWVEPGREEEGRRSFGRTPEMIEFFSRQLDCPYPYEKYAQVAVRHFHFGGMENASATTQSDTTLHDERAALDFSSDELVAHELAHQWFGDLITCKSWTHAWLNEGFATYFDALWKERDRGREEFDAAMVANAETYLAEPYRRAISTPRYGHPFQLFDAHLYPKAAWVLHMLRRKLGDDLFWKALRLYVKRHAHGVAETIDLIRAFEDATGRNLSGFFDQWIFSPGHPVLEGELSWDAASSCVKLAVKQAQKRENGTPIFDLPLRLEARTEDGSIQSRTFQMNQAEQVFFLPLTGKPVWALVDPDLAVLRERKIKCPPEWAEAALLGPARDPRAGARIDLARQLAEEAGNQATEILARTLLEDPFWAVQAEAARSLGKIRTPRALSALVAGTAIEHPKARRAVVAALNGWRDPRARDALLELMRRRDPSYFVEMQTLISLGACGGLDVAAEIKEALGAALERRDWHDAIAAGAILGLAAARDVSAIEAMVNVAADRSRYWNTRMMAISAAATVGEARPEFASRVADELVRFLHDPRILIAERTPGALVTLAHPSALGALQRRGETAARAQTREACLQGAEALLAKMQKGEEADRLRDEVGKLREEARQLKEQMEEIKMRVAPPVPQPQKPEEHGPASAAS